MSTIKFRYRRKKYLPSKCFVSQQHCQISTPRQFPFGDVDRCVAVNFLVHPRRDAAEGRLVPAAGSGGCDDSEHKTTSASGTTYY